MVSLVQRFHDVYYHFAIEAMGRLIQVPMIIPLSSQHLTNACRHSSPHFVIRLDLVVQVIDVLTSDRGWKVLLDAQHSFQREYLALMGVHQSQIIPHHPNQVSCWLESMGGEVVASE